VNTLPGKGRSHRYYLDPQTGVFKIQIGQAKIPLMPLLKISASAIRTSARHGATKSRL
jgi:hypothetical protein